jgi:hypothetical protein
MMEFLVSFYQPHLQNCLAHLIVETLFFLVVTVVSSNLGFEMVMVDVAVDIFVTYIVLGSCVDYL